MFNANTIKRYIYPLYVTHISNPILVLLEYIQNFIYTSILRKQISIFVKTLY